MTATTTGAGGATRAPGIPPRYHTVQVFQVTLCEECAEQCPELHPAPATVTIRTHSAPYCHVCGVRIERSPSQ